MNKPQGNRPWAGVSPESELTLLCCGPTWDQNARARAAALAAGSVDWERLGRIVDHHRLHPLMAARLGQVDEGGVPANLLRGWQEEYRFNRVRTVQLVQELIAFAQAANRAGVATMVLKGPLMAKELYGDAALRWSSDIDVMVAREQLTGLTAALETEGYRPLFDKRLLHDRRHLDERYDVCFQRPEGVCHVEVHWQLLPRHTEPWLAPRALWQHAESHIVGGMRMLQPCWQHLFLYLCVHGGDKHHFGLRFLGDLARMIQGRLDDDWDSVLTIARHTGAVKLVRLAAALSWWLLGARLPPALQRENPFTADVMARAALVRGRLFRDGFGLPGYTEWLHYLQTAGRDSAGAAALRPWRYLAAIGHPEFGDREFAVTLPPGLRSMCHLARPLRLLRTHSLALLRRLG